MTFRGMIRCFVLMSLWGGVAMGAVGEGAGRLLDEWFAKPEGGRGEVPKGLMEESLATAEEAEAAAKVVWESYRKGAVALGWDKEIAVIPPTLEELKAMPEEERPRVGPSTAEGGGKTMPYFLLAKGKKPEGGWPLFLSLHGGGSSGGTSGAQDWPVNTREWQSQLALFERVYPENALYLIPRMADDNDGRWWFDYCQEIYQKMIRRALLFREVDPDRVMVMGISEGGYAAFRLPGNQPGVWAAAGAMAAAEPMDTSPPENLMHTALRCDIGEQDTMFDRIGLARNYFKRMGELAKEYPKSYVHHLEVQEGRGHGIDYAGCAPWMLTKTRDSRPKEVLWKVQKLHNTLHRHHHWLALAEEPEKLPLLIHGRIEGQGVVISVKDGEGKAVDGVKLRVLLDDLLLDPGKPVSVTVNGVGVYEDVPGRNVGVMARTLAERGDPKMVFCAEVISEQ